MTRTRKGHEARANKTEGDCLQDSLVPGYRDEKDLAFNRLPDQPGRVQCVGN